jgi:hypothetical protein
LARKSYGLLFTLNRYSRLSMPLMIGFIVCLLWPTWRKLQPVALRKSPVMEQVSLAVAFLVVYLVLPRDYADAAFVDIRALPMMTLCLMLACLYLTKEGGCRLSTLPALALAVTLASANLAMLVFHLKAMDAAIGRYRAVAASMPRGAAVLPIYTLPVHSVEFLLHAASFAVLDRDALMPSLFSRDRGDPMKYFRYRHRPYAPDEGWYYPWMTDTRPVDWNKIACGYDFLLVTVPFDAQRIQVPTTVARANDVVALLAVDRRACRQH